MHHGGHQVRHDPDILTGITGSTILTVPRRMRTHRIPVSAPWTEAQTRTTTFAHDGSLLVDSGTHVSVVNTCAQSRLATNMPKPK